MKPLKLRFLQEPTGSWFLSFMVLFLVFFTGNTPLFALIACHPPVNPPRGRGYPLVLGYSCFVSLSCIGYPILLASQNLSQTGYRITSWETLTLMCLMAFLSLVLLRGSWNRGCCRTQGRVFRVFYVLNRVRISNPWRHPYAKTWLKSSPSRGKSSPSLFQAAFSRIPSWST